MKTKLIVYWVKISPTIATDEVHVPPAPPLPPLDPVIFSPSNSKKLF